MKIFYLEGLDCKLSLFRVTINSTFDLLFSDKAQSRNNILLIVECTFFFTQCYESGFHFKSDNLSVFYSKNSLFYFNHTLMEYFFSFSGQKYIFDFNKNFINVMSFSYLFYFDASAEVSIGIKDLEINKNFLGTFLLLEDKNFNKKMVNLIRRNILIKKGNFHVIDNTKNFIVVKTFINFTLEQTKILVSKEFQRSHILAQYNQAIEDFSTILRLDRIDIFCPKSRVLQTFNYKISNNNFSLLHISGTFSDVLLVRTIIKLGYQNKQGLLTASDIKNLTVSASKFFCNYFLNANSSFIYFSSFQKKNLTNIAIISSFISFNKVANGGIFSFFLTGESLQYKIILKRNIFKFNTAAYKGGLFFLNTSDDFPVEKRASDLIRVESIENKIGVSWAPQGSFTFFEGNWDISLLKNFSEPLGFLKNEQPKLLGSVRRMMFISPERNIFSESIRVNQKIFSKLVKTPKNYYFCLAMLDSRENHNFVSTEDELHSYDDFKNIRMDFFLKEILFQKINYKFFKCSLCAYIF